MSNYHVQSGRAAEQFRRPDTLIDASSARNVLAVIRTWAARGRERRVLGEMEAHELNDIGISRAQALRETRKWFWQR